MTEATQASEAKEFVPQPVIRLDRSKPFSTCHGDRMPDDPLYKVCYWQGPKVGHDHVLLPFDANGLLVPDDNQQTPLQAISADGKPVSYTPLYSPRMREVLKQRLNRMTSKAAAKVDPVADALDAEEANAGDPSDDVNFESWLLGEVRYQPHELRTAAKKRFSRVYKDIYPALVVDLVVDEKLVPEDKVCAALKKYLPN